MAASKISLKLLIDTKNNKVLIAEASKKFVDFLFHLLSLPLGTAIKLLRKQETVGSLENVFRSIENLDETYIQPNQHKDIFLSPKTPAFPVTVLALEDSPEPEKLRGKAIYKCTNSCSDPYHSGNLYVSDDSRAVCPRCNRNMTSALKYVEPPKAGGDGDGGFVKGVVTYMLMDNLEVKPMSTISCIALLNKFNVKDLSVLEEKYVDLGMDEALKLLKASMESKTVLTSVFLSAEPVIPIGVQYFAF